MNDAFDNIHDEIVTAEKRIRPHVRETWLEYSPWLSGTNDGRVSLKLENLQLTGSFKIRGAANKLLSLSGAEKGKGVVTASSGNHAAAMAHLLQEFAIDGTIYLPKTASKAKIQKLRSHAAKIKLIGEDCIVAERAARKDAEASGRTFISPYNDIHIIAGQGTVGMEMLRRTGAVDTVLVPVGGGGLIAGIGAFLKHVRPDIDIIGCQPENSAVMYESVKAGRILDMPSKPTLSDGTAGGIEAGAVTFDICRKVVDDFILVSEEEIRNALRLLVEKHAMLVEGAGALTVAAFLKTSERFQGKNIVLVVSGRNVGLDQLKRILS